MSKGKKNYFEGIEGGKIISVMVRNQAREEKIKFKLFFSV